MTDRELLELAARAAGVSGEWCVCCDHEPGIVTQNDNGIIWNPLENDDDALRLAVKRHINIEYIKSLKTGEIIEVGAAPVGRGDCLSIESVGNDTDAATRRAITRAAAATIGEALR